MIFFLKVFLHLTHYFRLFKCPLFLHIELASQLYHLILLNERLIIKDLSELLLILLELFCVLLYLGGLLAHLLHLIVKLFILSLKQGDLFL